MLVLKLVLGYLHVYTYMCTSLVPKLTSAHVLRVAEREFYRAWGQG